MGATYKIFTTKGDREVKLEEIPALIAKKEIKPETRILNNETSAWIDFMDYNRLHKILSTLRVELYTGIYKVHLGGKEQDLDINQVDKLLKEGIIKPNSTKVLNKEIGMWIYVREYSRLFDDLLTFNSIRRTGMALSPYELAVNKAKSEKEEKLRQRIQPKKAPLMDDVERRLESIRQEPQGKSKSTRTESSADTSSLIICKNCNQSISKRAVKCPKCGHGDSGNCNICKRSIPKNSTSCPECGDPTPFATNLLPTETTEKSTLSQPQPNHKIKTAEVSQDFRKQPKSSQKAKILSPDESIRTTNEYSPMNPWLRWFIIIGGSFLVMLLFSVVAVIEQKSRLTGGHIIVVCIVYVILYYSTKPKKT
jgi:RNA polymerase subunit RPABC4/transcription elongation factor Spt4